MNKTTDGIKRVASRVYKHTLTVDLTLFVGASVEGVGYT